MSIRARILTDSASTPGPATPSARNAGRHRERTRTEGRTMSGIRRRSGGCRGPRWVLAAAAAVALTLGALTPGAGPALADPVPAPPVPVPSLDADVPPATTTVPTTASVPGINPSSAVAQVGPSVVNINTQLGYARAVSAGTGIVLDPSGVVLTNNHVIAGATEVSAMSVANQQSYDVEVLGYDRTHDVALIKLRGATGLPVATIGDPNSVAVGDDVISMGNAGGQGGTPSAVPGTVTALDQTVSASDDLTGASETLTGKIRASTPLRPGDSGGPMVNAAGEVIGVNTAASENYKMAQPGGEGFAIPINQAMAVANQIRSGNASDTVHIGATPFLGIGVVDAGGSGVKVVQVLNNTPAEQAGVRRGDILLALAGDDIDSATTLTRVIDQHHPGDTVELRWRSPQGGEQSANIVLAVGPAG